MQLPPSSVIGIDHVGIAVADLDAAITMYETAFGMRCVHTEVNEEQGVREAMLEVGSSGTYLQLLSPLSPDTTIGRFQKQVIIEWFSTYSWFQTPPRLRHWIFGHPATNL